MKKLLVVLTILVLGVLLLAGSALALPTLRLTAGAVTIEVADGSGLDSSSLPGVVTFNGTVGTNWVVNVTTGLTKPQQGTASTPFMDLNSLNQAGASGTLTIQFSETGFTFPQSPASGVMTLGGTQSGPGSITYSAYYDASNTLFSGAASGALVTTTLVNTLGPFTGASFSGATSGPIITAAGAFSLTEQVIITREGGGSSSFDAQLQVIPEPATMLLVGTGLVGVAGICRRKFRK